MYLSVSIVGLRLLSKESTIIRRIIIYSPVPVKVIVLAFTKHAKTKTHRRKPMGFFILVGWDEGIRTPDLRIHNPTF